MDNLKAKTIEGFIEGLQIISKYVEGGKNSQNFLPSI